MDPETVLRILGYYEAPEALEYRPNGPFLEEGLCIQVLLPLSDAATAPLAVSSTTAETKPESPALTHDTMVACKQHVPAKL